MEDQKKILEDEIVNLNEEIRGLASQLQGILNVDCNMGLCTYDPEADDLQEKMREVQKKKALLESIRKNIESCDLD